MTQAKYLEVAAIINQRIKDGTYQARSALPDQESLAQEFGVSRLTVKKALDGLERKGLVYKQSGLGTFVAGDIPIQTAQDAPANMFVGLQNQYQDKKVTSKILSFTVEFPNQKIQDNLDIKKANQSIILCVYA